MRRACLACFACAVLVLPGRGRSDEEAAGGGGSPSWLADHVKLRRSLDDKNQASKPAAVMVTLPGGGRGATWAIDAGLKAADCLSCRAFQLEWNLGAEYHRHTDIQKPQNAVGASAGLELLLGPREPSGGLVSDTMHDLVLTAQFKSDVQHATRSALVYLDYTPIDFLRSGLVVPSKKQAGGKARWVAFSWLPTVGPEMEDVAQASGQPTGTALRLRGALDVGVYPLATAFDSRVLLYGRGEIRQTLASSTSAEPVGTWTHLVRAGALHFFDEAQRFAVGVEYANGQNPREGLAPQENWQIGLRVQLPGKKEK